jgi:HK97 family phage major capsid protein
MKTKIRLKKAWKNGDTEWPEGQILEMSKDNADALVSQDIAELYEVKELDVIVVSEVNADPGYTKAEVDAIVKELEAKNSAFEANQNGADSQEEKFLLTGGFKGIHHFAQEVARATVGRKETPMLADYNKAVTAYVKAQGPDGDGLQEGVGPDGGFLVPTEFRNTLMKNTLEASLLLNRATRIPMATNQIAIPTVVDASHASSVFGGIIVYRPAEGASITASKPKFGKVELKLSKLAAVAYITSEMLEDSPISMEPLLGSMFSEAMAFQIDEDMINGTGVGQALGMLNAPSLISVAKESGQAADTIDFQNVIKMWARLMSRSHGSAIWLANQDTFAQLASLAQPVGTGGSAAGLLQIVTNGATGAPLMTLLGRQLFLTEHCQTLGDKGDLMLIDPRQYLVGEKAGGAVKTATSIHLKFLEDEVAFRFTTRLDGQPWEKTALTPKHSTATLSSFITLAARA